MSGLDWDADDATDGDATDEVTADEVRARAVSFLARREHSRQELAHKLTTRGAPASLVEEVIDELAGENLQSDRRFAEQYARSRAQRGHGPLKIRAELRERGIDDHLVADAFAEAESLTDWFELATEARWKRFGQHPPETAAERAKQTRFLQQRGFSHEQIRAALESSPESSGR